MIDGRGFKKMYFKGTNVYDRSQLFFEGGLGPLKKWVIENTSKIGGFVGWWFWGLSGDRLNIYLNAL